MIELPSPNWNERPAPVDMLILHYTGMQSARAAIDRLRDPAAKVSSHYVIDEDGGVYRLVPEEHRAFHAGLSFWAGRTNLNDVSIGIELVNPGHEWGYRPFPETQMRRAGTAGRRHPDAACDPAAACTGPFRRRARPQAGSRRAVRLAKAGAARNRRLARSQ